MGNSGLFIRLARIVQISETKTLKQNTRKVGDELRNKMRYEIEISVVDRASRVLASGLLSQMLNARDEELFSSPSNFPASLRE